MTASQTKSSEIYWLKVFYFGMLTIACLGSSCICSLAPLARLVDAVDDFADTRRSRRSEKF